MRVSHAIALLAATGSASAFFRMGCNQPLVFERVDPIVSPGKVSGHTHAIHGGNGFSPSMTYDNARAATCSTCQAKADLSNYWVPNMYFMSPDGKNFTLVPSDGMTVYYLQRYNSNNNTLKAFPPGFRMLAGNPSLRAFNSSSLEAQGVSHVCLDYNGSGAGGQWNYLPQHRCPNGVRTQVFFPSCWDGVNVDSEDHKSHVAFPSGTDHGDCPSSHPVRLVSIFYEVIWATDQFADVWYGDGPTKQPFVHSMGDPTGYGYHGDFVNGWDTTILQKAVDECTDNSGVINDCTLLDLRTSDEMNDCFQASQVPEQVTGSLDKLPGCNAVTYVQTAAPASCGATTTLIAENILNALSPAPQGWEPVGCLADNGTTRVLPQRNAPGGMTVELCTGICKQGGFKYAGLEWSQECWCGNSVPTGVATGLPCAMPCQGNASERCGGSAEIAVYKQGTAPPPTTSAKPTSTSAPPTSKPPTSTAKPASSTPKHTTTTSKPAITSAKPTSAKPTATPSPAAWRSKGCWYDTVSPRSLNGTARWTGNLDDMTVEKCQAHCESNGFILAGVEWGIECFCGNSLHNSKREPDSSCNMHCAGDAKELCGAGNRLNIYERVPHDVPLRARAGRQARGHARRLAMRALA